MITIPYNRARVLGCGAALLALWSLSWYARDYGPGTREAGARERAVAERERSVRAARTAAVVHGPAGLDSLLARLRADSMLAAARVPPASEGAAVAAQVKDVLARAERQGALRVTATEPLPPAAEGRFRTAGYSVRVVGRYAEVGQLLAALASLDRLTRTRGFRLHAVPDSLVRRAEPFGAPGAGAMAPADSAGTAASLADAGETPFQAAAMFSLVWYTLPPSDDSAPLLPGGAR